MKRGLSGLATIGSTAPFVGLFGTVVGIINAFKGIQPKRPPAFPQWPAVFPSPGNHGAWPARCRAAVWAYNYFTNKVEAFDVEMDNSSMELVNYFITRRGGKK